jgi:hypothetical protein
MSRGKRGLQKIPKGSSGNSGEKVGFGTIRTSRQT